LSYPKSVKVANLTGQDLAISVCVYDGLNICISKTIEGSNHASAEFVIGKTTEDGTPIMEWKTVKVVRG